ncbi:putative Ig domain-containing protein, partial [Candidatus Latescibacterota bacterium]
WLNIDNNGVLSGTPSNDNVGSGIPVTVQVIDSNQATAEASYTIDVIGVIDVNNPPVIATTEIPNAVEDVAYSVTIDVNDPDDGDTHTFELVTGPGWLYIDPNNGVLSGTPSNDDVGSAIQVAVRVTDSDQDTAEVSYTINVKNVNASPVIVTSDIPDATENEEYGATIEIIDSDDGDTHTFALPTGPVWLSIDPNNGVLSGTPSNEDVASDIQVTVRVTDSYQATAEASYTINVLNVNNAPVFVTTELPNAVEETAYSNTLKVDDPDTDDTFTFELLESPAWLSMDEMGVLSGTPSNEDVGIDIPVKITVTDAEGLADTLSTVIVVINVNDSPVFITTELSDANEGVAYADTVEVTDQDGDEIINYEMFEGPEWLTIDNNGILSGTPIIDDVGSGLPVSIIAEDSDGLADTLFTSINVLPDVVISKIIIAPGDTLVNIKETIQYIATALNILENIVEGADIQWSVEGEIGKIDKNGEFTAQRVGSGYVVATVGEISAEASVTVSEYQVIPLQIEENDSVIIIGLQYPLNILNGMKLDFPEGAFSDIITVNFTIPTFAHADYNTNEVSFEKDIISGVSFEVLVNGEVVSPYYFDVPVEVTIPYDKDLLDKLGIDPALLTMFFVTPSGDFDSEGITDVVIDEFTNMVTGKVIHFSDIAVGSKILGPAMLGDFDYNKTVDFYDFVQLVVYWNAGKTYGDIVGKPDGANPPGPLPWYKDDHPYPPDGAVDFEDFAVFALMYNWYHSQDSGALAKPAIAAKTAPFEFAPGLNWDKNEYNTGDTFMVTMNAGNITDFLGAEIKLDYDSSILKVNSVNSGLAMSGADFEAPVQYKSSGDMLTANTVVLGSLDAGLSLEGKNIFEVEFEVIGEGNFNIELTDTDLRNFMNTQLRVHFYKFNNENTVLSGKATHTTMPLAFGLLQNYPNPFNMSTTLVYSLNEDGKITLNIYNAIGQLVATLENRNRNAGKYTIVWNGTDNEGNEVTSGIYIVSLRQGRHFDTKRIILVK